MAAIWSMIELPRDYPARPGEGRIWDAFPSVVLIQEIMEGDSVN